MTDTVLLSGVVGSVAYGLDRPGSDVDRLAVFATSAAEIAGWGWTEKRQTRVTRDPDSTAHEVRKFLRLALRANPTVTELLWLEEYETLTPLGAQMLAYRADLLSRTRVADAYVGYARAQLDRLRAVSVAAPGPRAAKHARHVLRLLRQGRGLLETGALRVRVDDPADYWMLDDLPRADTLRWFERELQLTRDAAARSPLPEHPNEAVAVELVARVRQLYP